MITENVLLNRDFSWTDIENPLKMDFSFLNEEFGLPLLYVHDCVRPEQLPKYEHSGHVFFFLVRIYDPACINGDISVPKLSNKLAIFINQGRVITLHNDTIVPLRKFIDMKRAENNYPDIRTFVHEIMRICILSFEEAIIDLQTNYERYEAEVLSKESTRISNTNVYQFRRKIYVVRLIMQLMQQALYNSREFWGDKVILQQDIKENIEQIYFKLEGLSHNSDQLFALNLSINEQKNNDVIKILTIFSSIMLPLTFIASFYGMNFVYLPGLNTPTGLVAAIVLMITITFITIWFFNKKQWFKSM